MASFSLYLSLLSLVQILDDRFDRLVASNRIKSVRGEQPSSSTLSVRASEYKPSFIYLSGWVHDCLRPSSFHQRQARHQRLLLDCFICHVTPHSSAVLAVAFTLHSC